MARPFDETVGKISLHACESAECLSYCTLAFHDQLSRIEQPFQAEDYSCFIHAVLASQNPNQLDEGNKGDEARHFPGQGLEKLYRALTLCRVILREKPYQDIGIQACHLHTLNLQR